METDEYLRLKNSLIESGYEEEIEFIRDLLENPHTDAETFLCEYIFVVVNSGMKNQIAVKIYDRIIKQMNAHRPIIEVFKHEGKVKAIENMIENYEELHGTFLMLNNSVNKLDFLKSLPWIGDITKYHLARNLGIDVTKPDRHLVRIAQQYGTTPQILCETLSKRTGDKVGVVDVVLWRAANLKMI